MEEGESLLGKKKGRKGDEEEDDVWKEMKTIQEPSKKSKLSV